MIWGDDIGHLPTPTRRNLSTSVREDSSPGGGPSDHEGHQPCGFCYHEDKSQMCEDCGHIACVACIEIIPHGLDQWRSLCLCCVGCPSTKTSSEKGSPAAVISPGQEEGEEDILTTSSVWPPDIDQKLLEAIYKMQEDMHPARFYGLFLRRRRLCGLGCERRCGGIPCQQNLDMGSELSLSPGQET